MTKRRACVLWIAMVLFSLSFAHAQSPQQIIQRVVDTEHAANRDDHSQWIYLEKRRKPSERVLQWVASTPHGNVERILEKNEQGLSDAQQRELIQGFLRDGRAQKKQIAENNHDSQQIDDLLQLLPIAFLWTKTGASTTATFLHFEPAPNFHPPTREARVFSSMAGDLIVDNQQYRVRSMSGHLIHEVTFGGGLLGKLKQGSSFSLDQEQVGPSLWQLTAFHIRLEGNALLFKSVSLQEDDERANFGLEPSTLTLDQAAAKVMSQPQAGLVQAGLTR